MIIELRYLHLLHTSVSAPSVSLSLHLPLLTHTHPTASHSLFTRVWSFPPHLPSLSHWLWTVTETACDSNPSPVLLSYINATQCWSPEPYFQTGIDRADNDASHQHFYYITWRVGIVCTCMALFSTAQYTFCHIWQSCLMSGTNTLIYSKHCALLL